jgi:hypothetical protein
MRTYYRGPDILITDEAFIRRAAPQQIFAIRGLRDVVIARGDSDASRPRTLHIGAGALILAAVAWPILDTPAAFAAAALIMAVPGAAILAGRRLAPRRFELRATYQGQDVLLFASSDETTFNQVGRGLRRALEDSGPPASSYGLAGG